MSAVDSALPVASELRVSARWPRHSSDCKIAQLHASSDPGRIGRVEGAGTRRVLPVRPAVFGGHTRCMPARRFSAPGAGYYITRLSASVRVLASLWTLVAWPSHNRQHSGALMEEVSDATRSESRAI